VAALELVRERGIAHLTTREVAARAGVSDASIYYHFSDRAGLVRAIYEHGMKPLALAQNPEAGTDLQIVIERAYAALVTFFEDVVPILHAAQADSELGQQVAAYIREQDLGPHKGVIALGAYLRGEQEAGRANPEADPEAVALMIIDTAFSRVSRRQFMMNNEDQRLPAPERELAMITQLLRP
jgi:AcrR family transcriptional regulator